MLELKKKLLDIILSDIEAKIESLKQSIQSAKESRDNETKSSVGDKYETGRTLMQMEVEKNRVQLNKTENLKRELQQINCKKTSDKVKFGSLVFTNQNNYFISAAIGKINMDNTDFYCISLASPIGKMLSGKTVESNFQFNRKEIKITQII